MSDVPVLIIIFNRPDKVRSLINSLGKIKPSRLFISADSPRPNRPEDIEKCAESRKLATTVSWPCSIETNFSETNLGCRLGVSSAITWFFSHVDRGIILEDDCMPDPSFFPYANDLLERYKDEEKIMHISGTTLLDKEETSEPNLSYHFSRIAHVWGWASWKRAWDKFDINMADLDSPDFSKKLDGYFEDKSHSNFWLSLFKHVRDQKIDTWDAQWNYSISKNNGLSITPNTNMISNIGFGADATHTKESGDALPEAVPIAFPLIHPINMKADKSADKILMRKVYAPGFLSRIKQRLKSIF